MKQYLNKESHTGAFRLIANRNWMGIFLVLVVVGVVIAGNHDALATDGPDPVKLVGNWQRPDGGYVLQLSDPTADGRLQAAYFNPKPINVSVALWKHQEGHLGAFIQLNAPNYPGSTYTLVYDVAGDRLVGLYFQAAMQQQFEVEFKRIR